MVFTTATKTEQVDKKKIITLILVTIIICLTEIVLITFLKYRYLQIKVFCRN